MQHADYFESFLKNEVNLDQTRLDKLGARVDSVYGALAADATIGSLITGMSRQGSWAHKLIIRPRTGADFDADFLLAMTHEADWEPARYINEVYQALHRHSTYSKQEHGRKCRCVWLKYSPEKGIGCHLDIVPFITLPEGRHVIVHRDSNTWEPQFGSTDPQGFTDWVKRRDELTGNQFRKVVRLMKFLKRQLGSFDGVRSVILTTVLGLQVTEVNAVDPARYSNLPTALINIVEDLDNWLRAWTSKPPIGNPNGDGTNFDHRWTNETFLNFQDRIHSIAPEMREAYDETDPQKSASAWQKLFGEAFNPPVAKLGFASPNPFASITAVTSTGSSRSGRSG